MWKHLDTISLVHLVSPEPHTAIPEKWRLPGEFNNAGMIIEAVPRRSRDPVNFGECDGRTDASVSPSPIDINDRFSRERKEHMRLKISEDDMEL